MMNTVLNHSLVTTMMGGLLGEEEGGWLLITCEGGMPFWENLDFQTHPPIHPSYLEMTPHKF